MTRILYHLVPLENWVSVSCLTGFIPRS